jgi:hypothetical protein
MEDLEKYKTDLRHSLPRDISCSDNPRHTDFLLSIKCPLNHSLTRPFKTEFDSKWWNRMQLEYHFKGYHGMTGNTKEATAREFFAAKCAKVARIERQKLEELQRYPLTISHPSQTLRFMRPLSYGVHPTFLRQVQDRIERARQRRLTQEAKN